MRLPNYKRFLKTDFETDYHNLIDKLSFSINNGIEVLYNALNRNISLKDNIYGTYRDLDIEVDSNGTPKINPTFTVDLKTSVLGIQILKAENLSNSTSYPTSAPWISWTATNNGIRIDNIRGIQANNLYKFRLFIYG